MTTIRQNFTDKFLRKSIHRGTSKRTIIHDSKQGGLTLHISSTGVKTFWFQRWSKQLNKAITKSIGKYPSVSITQARSQAAQWLMETNHGIDIAEAAKERQQEDTFSGLFTQWLEIHAKPHKKSWVDDAQRYNLYIHKQLGAKRISWFTSDKIRKWHFSITQKLKQRPGRKSPQATVSQSTANRALALLSTTFNQMLPDTPNPCKGVKKFRETSRDRFLQPSELERFFKALNDRYTPEYLKDYLMLSLLTGARRANILGMQWKDINLDRQVWKIPAQESKNGETMTVPLVVQAREILKQRAKDTTSPFVFPGKGRTGHITEPKKAWASLLQRAELEDIRIHDLRRTMGSYQTMSGASTAIVGKTLGHKSQQSTAVYARLNLDPVRKSMEDAVDLMMKNRRGPDNIISLAQYRTTSQQRN